MKVRLVVYIVVITALFLYGFVATPQLNPSYPSDELGYLKTIHVPLLHKLGLDGTGVRIAILGTGLNASLPAFKGRKVLAWKDFVNNRSAPYDDNGHDTAVASVLAGNPLDYTYSNGTRKPAFIGVAYSASLVIGKVIDANNDIKNCTTVSDAIHWAVSIGVDLINLSLYCRYPTNGQSIVDQAVNWAAAQGVLVVTIAGNFGNATSSITPPCDAAGALCVGAVNFAGNATRPYSGVGPTADGRIKPDVVAPSGSEYANTTGIIAVTTTGGITNDWWGTSFSAPLVTGVAALLKQWKPTISEAQLKEVLISSAVAVGSPSPNNVYGNGLVNAEGAFTLAFGQSPESVLLWREIQNGSLYGIVSIIAITAGTQIGKFVRRAKSDAVSSMLGI